MKAPLTTYRVVWKMDIDASSPLRAAEMARGYQRDPFSEVGCFEVHFTDDRGPKQVAVDLDGEDA